MYDLGNTIYTLRKQHKWTQKALASRLGVSEATMSKYEANTVTHSFETLRTIASQFNVSMDTLREMTHQGFVSTYGISSDQAEIINQLKDDFRLRNNSGQQKLTDKDCMILGQIVAEFTK